MATRTGRAAKDVEALVEKLKTQKGIIIDQKIIPGANHFFDGKIEPLMQIGQRPISTSGSSRAMRERAAMAASIRLPRSPPPVIGCGAPVVVGNVSGSPLKRAHRQIGEGLRPRAHRPASRAGVDLFMKQQRRQAVAGKRSRSIFRDDAGKPEGVAATGAVSWIVNEEASTCSARGLSAESAARHRAARHQRQGRDRA